MTTVTLRESSSNHSYQGFIHKHRVEIHVIHPKLDYLLELDNAKIIYQALNDLDLPVFEALQQNFVCLSLSFIREILKIFKFVLKYLV